MWSRSYCCCSLHDGHSKKGKEGHIGLRDFSFNDFKVIRGCRIHISFESDNMENPNGNATNKGALDCLLSS